MKTIFDKFHEKTPVERFVYDRIEIKMTFNEFQTLEKRMEYQKGDETILINNINYTPAKGIGVVEIKVRL